LTSKKSKRFDHPESGLAKWLNGDYFISQALTSSYHQVVVGYIDALLAWPCKFGSAARAGGRIREDAKILR